MSGNSKIISFLLQLQNLIQSRKRKFVIGHIRGHTGLPGPLALGNAMEDLLTKEHLNASTVEQALESHALHHQNALALRRMFNLMQEQARQIVKDCEHCPDVYNSLKMRVNTRALKAHVLWQRDVIPIPKFGKLAYVHVTLDTFSDVLMATARTGEAVKVVIQHLIIGFSFLCVPNRIKTDNAPAYTSQAFAKFCIQWGIKHTWGIP